MNSRIIVSFILLVSIASSCKIESAKNKSNSKPKKGSVEIEADKFKNPIMISAADPWILQKNGIYYFTHTTGNSIKLYRTKNIVDVVNAESKVVWTPPPTGMNSKQIWAPEIHYIHGMWYLFYAADDGHNKNHRMWVLENTSSNPLEGEWTDKGKMMLPDDKWAIDATMFEIEGQLFCVWSGWEGDENVSQNIYISKMKNPWASEGERTMISSPEFEWEKKKIKLELPVVNEGPAFLKKDNQLFIVYSASGCWTDDYSLGILATRVDADLMNPRSWVKSKEQVFKKNPDGKAFGPGHNGFFKSADGKEDWIIYHANPESGQGCGAYRSARIQKFGWKPDGMPDFGDPVSLDEYLKAPACYDF